MDLDTDPWCRWFVILFDIQIAFVNISKIFVWIILNTDWLEQFFSVYFCLIRHFWRSVGIKNCVHLIKWLIACMHKVWLPWLCVSRWFCICLYKHIDILVWSIVLVKISVFENFMTWFVCVQNWQKQNYFKHVKRVHYKKNKR